MKPIFIFSLPRSGSTLLNRLLASHTNIASHSEPWFLLPLFYMDNYDDVSAEYNHGASSRGVRDVIDSLGGEHVWKKYIREFSLNIYTGLSNTSGKEDVLYFVDKTPKYHVIADDIINTFSDAKIIVLVRNPISCLASGIETWSNGRLTIQGQYSDLYDGPCNLARIIKNHKERIHLVKYEDLISNKEIVVKNMLDYLELDYEPIYELISDNKLRGSMGDPVKNKENRKTISTKSIKKYESTFGTLYRKRYALNYIKAIDKEILDVLGYDQKELIADIKELPSTMRKLPSDIFFSQIDKIWRVLDLSYFRKRLFKLIRGEKLLIRN